MRRQAARDTGALAAGAVVGGVLAYVFFGLVTRSIGAAAAAPVSVLWTYWTAAAAVLTFPLQHWTIRTLTATATEGAVARMLPRIWLAVAIVSLASGGVAYIAREPLFRADGVAFPAMVAGVTAGAALMGITRGGLAGRGRYTATALALSGENAVRAVLAAIVAVLGGGAAAFGWVLVAGPLLAFAWPRSLRFARDDDSGDAGGGLGLASALAGGSLISQLVLTGGPVVLAVIGGAARDVTALFVSLAVWRAPYIVALGIAPQYTATLTRLTVGDDTRRLQAIRRWTIVAIIGMAVVAVAAGATFLGPVIGLVFGQDVRLDDSTLAVIGAGTAVALGNLMLTLALLAAGRSRATLHAWAVAVVAGLVWVVVGPGGAVARVVGGFVAAECVALAWMFLRQRGSASLSRADATRVPPLVPPDVADA